MKQKKNMLSTCDQYTNMKEKGYILQDFLHKIAGYLPIIMAIFCNMLAVSAFYLFCAQNSFEVQKYTILNM